MERASLTARCWCHGEPTHHRGGISCSASKSLPCLLLPPSTGLHPLRRERVSPPAHPPTHARTPPAHPYPPTHPPTRPNPCSTHLIDGINDLRRPHQQGCAGICDGLAASLAKLPACGPRDLHSVHLELPEAAAADGHPANQQLWGKTHAGVCASTWVAWADAAQQATQNNPANRGSSRWQDEQQQGRRRTRCALQ